MLVEMDEASRPQGFSIMRILGTVITVGSFMAVLGIGVYARLTGRMDSEVLLALGLAVWGSLILSRVSGDLFALGMAAFLVLAATSHLA
jgi:hypothetical protein